ncbi:MBL fold metallo-hydrolase [Kitasatospora camelliae]|uniref:MBL fold metallo-hydrolase n=1 Tax=Kitasatospora camelliae TaxID=3156397 RepID=A0AAU8JS61_9ACTN
MQRIVLGDVEITRVVEWQGPVAPTRAVVPGVGEEVWKRNGDWLAPEFWDREGDRYVAALQTWVVRSEGRTVLVDTGVGNGRQRPATPRFDDMWTDFPDRLAAAGVHPEEVDVVVNTHLHADHVGWNTVAQDGNWVPMFPNARYLIPAADDARLDPAQAHRRPAPVDAAQRLRREHERFLYTDSVEPVHRAGLSELWDGEYRIDGNLVLEAAPGHTPGSSVLRLESRGERAVFVGDLLHSPVQILEPGCNSCFCEDPEQAAASRRRILERAADQRELVVPAHFGGAGAARVQRDGSRFTVSGWAQAV